MSYAVYGKTESKPRRFVGFDVPRVSPLFGEKLFCGGKKRFRTMAMCDEKDHFETSSHIAELRSLLTSIDRLGDYCAHGRALVPMPVLTVAGMDALSFPVPGDQVDALLARSRPSPFGRGEETLLDRKVRDSREIAPAQFSLEGTGWGEAFAGMLGAAADGLGCPRERLSAQIYKLLIYEPGGFFLPHRDTEKSGGMVATLVVALPVRGSGGEIIVRHRERETVIDMRGDEPSEIVWAAFYADCEHEIRPVLDGNRIVLVYNLVLSNGAGKLSAPDFGAETGRVAGELSAWRSEARSDDKIVWLLDHDYSEAGLSFDSLKNVDASVAGVLAEASEAAGYSLYAATVTIEEAGEAMEGEYEGSYEMGEIFEYFCALEHLVAPEGTVANFGKIRFSREEVLQTEALEDLRPEDESIEEWTGNAGATMERTYRLAALVLWPRENSLKLIASDDIRAAVGYVETLVESGDPEAHEFAARIHEVWRDGRLYRSDGTGEALGAALRILVGLGDASSAGLLLASSVAHYRNEENGDIRAALSLTGPDFARDFLPELICGNLADRPEAVFNLADELCRAFGGDLRWKEVLADRACSSILRGLSESLALKEKSVSSWSWGLGRDAELSPGAAANLLAAFLRLGLREEAGRAVSVLLDHPVCASPDRVIPRALECLLEFARTESFGVLWKRAAGFLLERSAVPPEPPGDWKIISVAGCGCGDCGVLRDFCEDPVAVEYRFKVNQSRRGHVSGVIEKHDLDITFRTEEKGRPYTLVCRKNRAAHERSLRRYEGDITEMKRLASMAPEAEAETLDHLNDALARRD